MQVFTALTLALIASSATGLGATLILFDHHQEEKTLAFSLGFSAGVMLSLSFWDLFPLGKTMLEQEIGMQKGGIVVVLCFLLGMVFIALLERLMPLPDKLIQRYTGNSVKKEKLLRLSYWLIISLTLHNFPEGVATYVSAINHYDLGVLVAFSIALHNIPEGMSIALPLYFATKKKLSSILLAFASGLSEFFGAMIAWLFLGPYLNDLIFGIVFSLVSGIMVYLGIQELYPTARSYDKQGMAFKGLLIGMLFMGVAMMML